MKKIIPILFFFFLVTSLFSQPFGNEWINYNQKYLKFKVTTDGIYRIDSTTLADGLNLVGESLSSIDPRNIQVFGRGQELYIHVEGENDGIFSGNDYIEFYAKKNSGWLDSLIYDSPSSQNNPYYSLFNDTAAYFLTWNNSITNKRMNTVNDQLFNTSPANYFMKELIDMGTNEYWGGEYYTNSKYDVSYTELEGYYYSSISGIGSTKTIPFNTQNTYTGIDAPNATLETVAAGVNNPDGTPDHHLVIEYNGNSGNVTLLNYVFPDFELIKKSFSIPATELGNSSTSIIYRNGSSSHPFARTAVAFTKIKYPHNLDLESSSSFMFIVPANGSKTYLNMTNFVTNQTSYVYDLTEHNRIKVTQSADNIKVNIPPGNTKKCYIMSDANFLTVSTLNPVSGNGWFRNFGAENPDSAFVVITHPTLYEQAKLYNKYRASTEGGDHDTITSNIIELYDQFAYGIGKHPLAIRNFAAFMLDNFSTAPQNLFLIGKSIKAQGSFRNNTTIYKQNLVPTIGLPPTDLLFTQGLAGNYYEPTIPVGRLAAKTPEEVTLYLDKVVGLETEQNKAKDPINLNFHDYSSLTSNGILNKDWMKHVVHFGGGENLSQQNTIKSYLNTYKGIIQEDLFGAHVHSVFKASSDVIEPNLADTIKGWIENGVSLITFFGHSSAQGFDVSLDDPESYKNENKYPLFIANGCFSGDIHNPVSSVDLPSTSEQFVLIEDAGAIGFISVIDQGYENMLHSYTKVLYEKIARDNYGASIGQCMKMCAKQMIDNASDPNSFTYRDVILEMSLHGDPAIKLNTHPLPDYYIAPNTVFFTPQKVTSDLSSFDINIVTYNLGKAVNDDVMIYVERTYEGGIDTSLINASAIHYNDTTTITYTMNNQSAGLNQFRIFVDWMETESNGNIEEISETNNSINFPSIDLWISSSDLVPIYPYNFAIVPDTNITLKASTADLFAVERTYRIQIDTTDTYDSQAGKPIDSTFITQSGGVVSWKPDISNFISEEDSTVFFWRCSPADEDRWREHSFQYIKNKTGWSQDHFFQFKNDDYRYINYDRNQRYFEMIDVIKQVKCKTIRNATNDDVGNIEYRIDGVLWDWNMPCGTDAMFIAIIDPVSLTPWIVYDPVYNPSSPHKYGNWNENGTPCGRGRADRYFIFRPQVQAELDTMIYMLNNIVPDGHYILAYTGKDGNFQTYWQDKHFQAFIDMGADSVPLVNLGNDIPYIFFTQKGDPTKTVEKRGLGIDYNEEIILTADIQSSANWGYITSPIIGPAARWDSLHWSFYDVDAGTLDSIFVHVYGIDWDGNEVKLQSYYIGEEDVYMTNDIDASQYPYIYLESYLRDDLQKTAIQLDKWQVIFEEIPEAALDPNVQFYMNTDTLYAGQDIQLSIAVENVSESNMDSLRISYSIEDQYGNYNLIRDNKLVPLLAGNMLLDTLSHQILGSFSGNNKLFVEVNPRDSLWQLEQYHFNNTAVLSFNVNKDITNPMLDVTFDGIHILNGDIVSSKPEIFIELTDENPYLALDDTSDFFIYLTDPNGNTEKVPFINGSGQEILIFQKAELPNNKASIQWFPEFDIDGTYKLSIQARDIAKNLAGDYAYNISFEVINKSTITHLLNYPNPFTTQTHFVFTLTGSVVPDVFKIQILTVTGKVVREITKDELGDIHIGRNITQYTWDGTDEYGDLLANGVYVYRVITKINGESVEHRTSGADDFFIKDFGKMYIMR